MSRLVTQIWQSNQAAPTRRERQSYRYEAFVPDRLCDRAFRFDADVAADVADAERAVARLNEVARALVSTEALARLLLRAESVASSRIEGLEIGARRLLRAEAALALGDPSRQVTAAEVLGNIAAMSQCVQRVQPGSTIEWNDVLAFHARLLSGTRLAEIGGKVRTTQNWIGGSSYSPFRAAFVPPPATELPALIADLCAFCNDDGLPAIAQAAIAHAQFETLHPFADGNGRTGRGLIHMILRRRGLAARVLPPVSLVLATRSADYIDGLTSFRAVGPADAEAAHVGCNLWVSHFAGACSRAVADVVAFERRAARIAARWRRALGRVRRDSAVDRLVEALIGAPLVTAQSAARLIGRSSQQTNEALARLVAAGVLVQVTVGRRNRAFEASAVIRAFSELERQLASPVGDTQQAPPARPVPARIK